MISIIMNMCIIALIARFTWPNWGPLGSCRTQVGPMEAPQALLASTVREMNKGITQWFTIILRSGNAYMRRIWRWAREKPLPDAMWTQFTMRWTMSALHREMAFRVFGAISLLETMFTLNWKDHLEHGLVKCHSKFKHFIQENNLNLSSAKLIVYKPQCVERSPSILNSSVSEISPIVQFSVSTDGIRATILWRSVPVALIG